MNWRQFVEEVTKCRNNPCLATPLLESGTLTVEDVAFARILHRATSGPAQRCVDTLGTRNDAEALWEWVQKKGVQRAARITCLVEKT